LSLWPVRLGKICKVVGRARQTASVSILALGINVYDIFLRVNINKIHIKIIQAVGRLYKPKSVMLFWKSRKVNFDFCDRRCNCGC
jgi:hypothetical protein